MSTSVETDILVQILREYYEIGSLSEKEQAEYRLISKYKDNVSDRLLNRLFTLMELGKKAFSLHMKGISYSTNPFLSLVSKEDFSGKYFPVYIKGDT